MIEAQRASGEMWRPRKAGQRARCWICGQDIIAERVRLKACAWAHVDGKVCRPGDTWIGELSAELSGSDYPWLPGRDLIAGDAVLLLAGGPTPAPDVDEREAAVRGEGRRPIWLVDGRHVASDFGRSYPGAEPPSWLAMAAWSEFAATWFDRPAAQVFIALDNYLQGGPAFFRAECAFGPVLRRKGGALGGIECCFAVGRLFILDGLLKAAMMPETQPEVHPLDTYRF
jgi:hypothetical protein